MPKILLGKTKTLRYHEEIALATSIIEGHLFQTIYDEIQKKPDAVVNFNGSVWCGITHKEWEKKINWISISRVMQLLQRLLYLNLIQIHKIDPHKTGNTKLWYSIDYQGLEVYLNKD